MVRISTRTPPYYHAYASPNGTVLPRVRQTTYASPNGTVPARARHRITMRTPNDVRVTQWNRTSTRTPPYYHAYAKRTYAIPINAHATQMYRYVRQCNAARCVPPSSTDPPPAERKPRRLPPNAAADPLFPSGPPTGRASAQLQRRPSSSKQKTFDGPLPTQLRTPSRRAGGQLHRRTSFNAAADSLPPSGRTYSVIVCFFDAETSQERPLQLNNQIALKHVPLLIVAEIICEPCIRAGISVNDGFGRRAPDCVCLCRMVRGQQMRRWSSPPFVNEAGDNTLPPDGAPTFNQRRFYFHSFDNEANDPIEQFLLFLMKHGPKKAHTVCIAHNGGKYDFHLVLEALHRRSIPPKQLCTTGLKIYSMKLRGMNQRRITFKDSINYFFCELDALVKSFDLPQHLATVKPFFPYLYIQRQHLLHRLNGLPAIEHYSPDTMKVEKRTKFLRWHGDNNADANFQLREQLILYCVNDVAILRESVLRFRQLIGEHTQGLDPFLCASTAAGLALATLRRCFLPANRLVHSPEGGYLRGRRASAESRRYIRFFELENQGAQVQCADWSVGEAHIEDSGYRVDGLWRREPPLRPLAIEWMGCFYHARARHRITTRTPNDVRVTQWYRTSTRTPPYYHAYAKRTYAIPINAHATQMYRYVRQCNAARCVPPSSTDPPPAERKPRRLPPNAAADPLFPSGPPTCRASAQLQRRPSSSKQKTFDGPLPTQLRTPSRRAGGQLHRRTSFNAAADSLPPSGRTYSVIVCFFDAETSQERPLQLNNQIALKHVPLLIVAEIICEPCIRAGISVNDGFGRRAPDCVCLCRMVRGQQMRRWSSPPFANEAGDNTLPPDGAPTFNQRRFYFHSFDNEANDPIEQFLLFLMKHGPKKAHTVCIAHNGGKYDFHLVLEALHRRSIPPKQLCTTGLKIYSMKLRGMNQRRITFKDSINYFFCELDALVKSFDLPQHLATVKPFFPYLYIQRQHLLHRLNGLPAIEHYSPDTMKVEKRTKFLRWHGDNNADANFQLREQLILYCVNDVAILRESVLRFRQLIGEHTQGLDPFLCASTAAGLALATLRRCFLPANRLVHSPEGGYLRGRRASAESRRYIRFFELENQGAQVQCADWSVGEAHIEDSGYRVDGLWRREPPLRPLAIEWMGCFYARASLIDNKSWQPDEQPKTCTSWKERLRRDHELKQRYEAVFTPCPLDPRNDALRGGRTEPFKLHHVCADDEEVLCIDIVSLYPYVMKVNPFPVGNPRVLTREVLLQPPTAPLPWTCPENNTFRGLLLVRVLAPRNIRVPLLGYRTKDERFTFPLCGLCADRRQQRPCRHDDDKRSWVCAYTHVELNKALQLGYVVTDLFEVWDYAEWDDTLFSSYVNSFVGLKVQASGWPEGCDTEEQRQAFVADFLRTENIQIDPTKVTFNPGLRLIAKTLANSLWGKLAQRVGHTEIQYTRTPAEFHKLLDDPTYDKLDFVHVSDHMDRVVVRKRPEFAKAPLTNCLPVAIFVTSYARLHLYGYMEQVLAMNNAELLYCDTDSIYYVNKIGAPCVPEGEALGQMKREHVDRRIVEFVAGGPKNYGIRHTARDGTDERANLKIRSFRLSYATQQLINFDAMKELTLLTYNIDGPIDDVIDNDDLFIYGGGAHRAIRVSFPQIDRNVQADLFTREEHKDYRPFYAKGRVRPGMQTRPFGYVEDAPHPMNVEQHAQPPPAPPVRRKRTLIEADPNQLGHSRWF
ncbi:hypothetical protein niasHS_012961 [Heterodera schachtii]|uniref:DNA-directed DNA polymerase n=1 Tax=Heterodera schachtii TaxID=97005 RepID=A0ABD2IKI3_HETSC